jgi:hypothetical protein
MISGTWAKARRIGVIVLVIVLLWLLSVIVLGLLAPDPMWENGRPSGGFRPSWGNVEARFQRHALTLKKLAAGTPYP